MEAHLSQCREHAALFTKGRALAKLPELPQVKTGVPSLTPGQAERLAEMLWQVEQDLNEENFENLLTALGTDLSQGFLSSEILLETLKEHLLQARQQQRQAPLSC